MLIWGVQIYLMTPVLTLAGTTGVSGFPFCIPDSEAGEPDRLVSDLLPPPLTESLPIPKPVKNLSICKRCMEPLSTFKHA